MSLTILAAILVDSKLGRGRFATLKVQI
jgi:hypothetical protein